MNIGTLQSATIEQRPTPAGSITTSPWVNQPLPDLREILSSRDLARLTRRPPWVLSGLAFLGKFPRKRRFRDQWVGWSRAEVVDWLSRDLTITPSDARLNGSRRCAEAPGAQGSLPLECISPWTRPRVCSPPSLRSGVSAKRAYAGSDRRRFEAL